MTAFRTRLAGSLYLGFLLLFVLAGARETHAQEASPETEVPTGFGSVRLGMSLEETRDALERDLSFDYRGEPDVSFLPRREEQLLEVEGRQFVDRGFFQFIDGRLYSIILDLNESTLDHYGVYTQLTEKYGESTRHNPREIL